MSVEGEKKSSSKSRSDRDKDKEREKEKEPMYTSDRALLLACVYFDQSHAGYLLDRDVEDVLHTTGLQLSRAQVTCTSLCLTKVALMSAFYVHGI